MPVPVLQVLGTADSEGTAIARIVAELATALDPNKYRVHAWFMGAHGPLVGDLEARGAAVRCIGWWRGARDPINAYRFLRLLKSYNFSIVHQHFGGRSVRRIVRLVSNAGLVVHLHEQISGYKSNDGVPVAVQGANVVIAASRAIANQIPTSNPIVVYGGVRVPERLCQRAATAREAVVIGTACRLVQKKGVIYLIRAISLLAAEFPYLALEIAGEGPERECLEGEVKRLNLTGRVRFLGWQRNLSATRQYWDVYVASSLEEGFGMAVLEAMADGLPVIATSVGGLPEVVADGQTGYIVLPSDVSTLSSKLRQLILDRNCRIVMGAAGRARAYQHFSVDRMVREIAAIYDALIANQRS